MKHVIMFVLHMPISLNKKLNYFLGIRENGENVKKIKLFVNEIRRRYKKINNSFVFCNLWDKIHSDIFLYVYRLI